MCEYNKAMLFKKVLKTAREVNAGGKASTTSQPPRNHQDSDDSGDDDTFREPVEYASQTFTKKKYTFNNSHPGVNVLWPRDRFG